MQKQGLENKEASKQTEINFGTLYFLGEKY